MSRAFAQLRNGKLGPVMLELPRDIAAATLKDDDFHYTPRRGYKSAGNPADVAEAAKLLLNAKRPILHVGHGVLWAQASAELLELAELVQVPVMTTMAGKSAFPEDHPLALGAGGHTLTRTAAHFLVKADVVFGIGSSFAKGGFSTPIPAGKTIVQVVVDGKDIDKDYTVDHAIIGDAKVVLQQLLAEVKRQLGAKGRGGSEVAEEVKNAKNVYLDEWLPRLTSDESPINPYRVIWDLMHTVDRKNTMLTHDSGNPRDQTMSFYESVAPRGYIGWGKSTQLGTGYGIAMGAKLANPDKLVINVMGDLAFGTAGMEVETAVREKIAIMTVLLNNSCMGGYGHHMPNASQAFNSNKLSGDYAGVAKALGAYSEKVERPEDVVGAIKRGIQATQEGRPVLLEMITKEEPVYPAAVHVLKDAASGTLTPIGH
jgi:acetolactate synthase-1/2/3 large subunit